MDGFGQSSHAGKDDDDMKFGNLGKEHDDDDDEMKFENQAKNMYGVVQSPGARLRVEAGQLLF